MTRSPPITAHLVALVHHQPDGVRQPVARAAGVPARVNNIDLGLDLDTTNIFYAPKYFYFYSQQIFSLHILSPGDTRKWVERP